MKRSLACKVEGIGACLLVASAVFAQPAAAAAAAPPSVAVCVACHGAHGEGGGGVPRLAGQDAAYLGHALSMFKAGTRASPIMQPMAAGLDDAEIPRLAEYFSKQEAPPVDAGASQPADRIVAGKRLAESGASNAAACFSCHGAQGLGNGARFPSIAAQPAQFIVDRLHEFQARAKAAAPQPGTMTAAAATLDESQIAEAAAYLSRLER
jgi:cytochrome c553